MTTVSMSVAFIIVQPLDDATQHIDQLRDLYCAPNTVQVIKSRRMECMGERRNSSSIFVGKAEKKRQLGRPMH